MDKLQASATSVEDEWIAKYRAARNAEMIAPPEAQLHVKLDNARRILVSIIGKIAGKYGPRLGRNESDASLSSRQARIKDSAAQLSDS
jgi:hypothetical protein